MTAGIHVAIVDDQPLLVSAFSALIDAQPDMEVALSAPDGRRAVELLTEQAQHREPVVLMDLRMPVLDGVGAITALRAQPSTAALPILVLTTFDDDALVLSSLRAGADGFLLKDTEPQTLLQAIRTIAAGGAWLDPAVTSTVLAQLSRPDHGGGGAPHPPPQGTGGGRAGAAPSSAREPGGGRVPGAGGSGLYEPLTPRESAVLELVCQGCSNAQIAGRLYLAESTVKSHVKAILGKTGCANRVELVIHAFATGLADLPHPPPVT